MVLFESEILATSLVPVRRGVSQGIYSQSKLLAMYEMIHIEIDIPSWWQCVPPTSKDLSFLGKKAEPTAASPLLFSRH